MQQEIIDLLDDKVFNILEKDFGIKKQDLKPLGQSEAFVYAYPKNNPSDIYRLTYSSHRSITDMEAEAEFILYLKSCGVQTMSSKYLKNDTLVSKIPCDKGYFILSRYSYEIGVEVDLAISKKQDLELAVKWGKLFAKLHEASIGLTQKIDRSTILEREWIHAKGFVENKEILKKNENAIIWLKSLSKTKDNYGLIHGDLHTGNILLDDSNEIIMLDFDDCLYHFYVDDLAVVLHAYSRSNDLEENWNIFEDDFTKTLLEAYSSVRKVPQFFYDTLENFIQLREQSLYTFYHLKELHLKESFQDHLLRSKKSILSYDVW
ncbi:MAG: hypothetical protein COB02_16360 [Candidatus Cloacimonadota bacterium]|nr:MAG: hypothetical protein COB02_16360 [Candidatus Cloacimonadota bacterium]